jgi:uncharacterized cupin superfamily protein
VKSGSRDIPVIAAAIFFVLLFAYLFYKEGAKRYADPQGNALGIITYRYHMAQRKANDTVLWHDVEQKEKVYNLDWLRTDENSEATLHLIRETEIQMDQNTMLILELEEERETVDILTGRVQVDRRQDTSKKPLLIRGGDQEILLEKGSAHFLSEDGVLHIQTEESGASILRGDEAITLEKHSTATLRVGEPTEKKMVITLVNPTPNKTIFTDGDSARLQFSWESDESVIFELSMERNFHRVIHQEATHLSSLWQTLPLGYYYWRVRSRERPDEAVRRLSVVKRESLKILSPVPGESITYHTVEPLVHFAWTGSEYLNRYRVLVSRNREFTQIVQDRIVETDRVSLPLGEGSYHWKVLPLIGLEEAVGEPRISHFAIGRTETLPIPRPLYPLDKELDVATLHGEGALFYWKQAGELSQSEIEISRDPQFKEIRMRQETRNNYLKVIQDLPPGLFYWRIRSFTEKGEATPYSNSATFRVGVPEIASVPPEPTDGEPERREAPRREETNLRRPESETKALDMAIPLSPTGGKLIDMTETDKIVFRWRESSRASAYRFRLIHNGNVVHEEIRTGTTFSFERLGVLDVGEFTWSIQALDEKRGLESPPQEGKFVITLRETPGMPTGISTEKK